MNKIAVSLAAALLVSAAAQRASAQVLPAPRVQSVNIPSTVVSPGTPIDMWFPNVVDPTHPKRLTFEGHAESLTGAPGTLTLWFDWLVPGLPPGLSDPFVIPFGPGPTPLFAEYVIPFCPPQVSLHIESDGFVVVGGVFVHECVPEPAEYALAGGLGLIGFAAWRRRLAA